MLPTQINAVYQYLCAKTDNPTEFTRQLALAGNEFTPVEAVVYLPMYSMGMGQSGITHRIQALRNLKFTVEGANAGQFTTEQIAGLLLTDGRRFGMPNRIAELMDRAAMIDDYGQEKLTNDLCAKADWGMDDLVNPLSQLMLFSGIGAIAAFHILMELRWNVVKPDRQICRFLSRLQGPWREYFPGGETIVLREALAVPFVNRWRSICAGFAAKNMDAPPPCDGINFPPLGSLTSRQIDILIMWFTQQRGPDELAWRPAPLCGERPLCARCAMPDCPARQTANPASIPQ